MWVTVTLYSLSPEDSCTTVLQYYTLTPSLHSHPSLHQSGINQSLDGSGEDLWYKNPAVFNLRVIPHPGAGGRVEVSPPPVTPGKIITMRTKSEALGNINSFRIFQHKASLWEPGLGLQKLDECCTVLRLPRLSRLTSELLSIFPYLKQRVYLTEYFIDLTVLFILSILCIEFQNFHVWLRTHIKILTACILSIVLTPQIYFYES